MAEDQSAITVRIHIFDDDDDEWYDTEVSTDQGDPTVDWMTSTARVDDPETTSTFTINRLFIPPGPPPLLKWNPAGKVNTTMVRYFLAGNGVVVDADRIVTGARSNYNGNISTGPGRAGRIEALSIQGTLSALPLNEWSDGERPRTDGGGA
jgi:hypothetical protein